ncbi:MAG: hypothetical protein WD827_02095 [Solirubrobacterales bacterium]
MRRIALILVLLAAVPLGADLAHGERTKQGDLYLSFNVGFSPHALPRDRLAPVTVDLSGSVQTASGEDPPQLRSIMLEVNRYGQLTTQGLPVCPRGELESTSPEVALERCRNALVGHGQFKATVDFPDRDPFPVKGKMLAFNSRAQGLPTILVHVHGSTPVSATIVLRFKITQKPGRFGTVLSAKIPKIAADLGSVTGISLTFGRKYRHEGEKRSFISARCAAPSGFPGATFSLAKGTFTFANEQQLAITLRRNCSVR